MGYEARAGEQPVKRVRADDRSVAPATQSQVKASRPPIVPDDVDTVVEDDGSRLAGGASGGTGGSSSTPGHPDAEQPRGRPHS